MATNKKGDYNMIRVFQTSKGFFGIIEGRLTRDATLSKNKKNEDVVSVGLATGEKSNKNRYVSSICRRAGMDLGENVEIENFISCTIKGKLGEEFSQSGKKGDHVIMCGNLSVFNDNVFMFPESIVHTKWVPGEDGKNHPENEIFGRTPVFTHVIGERQEVFCVIPGTIEDISAIREPKSPNAKAGFVYANVSTDDFVDKVYALGVNAYQKDKDYEVKSLVVFNSNGLRRDDGGNLVDTGENRLKNRCKKGTKVLLAGALSYSEDQENGSVSYKLSLRTFAVLSGGVFGGKSAEAGSPAPAKKAESAQSAAEPDVPAPEDTDGFEGIDEEEELPF